MRKKIFIGFFVGMIALTGVLAVVSVSRPQAVQAQDSTATTTASAADATQQPSVSLTVYNQGTALVQDRRNFDLTAGENTVNFTDVASGIDPTSVSFHSLTDPTGTYVIEQNYVYDLVNSDALLQRYLDQKITLTALNGATTETIQGTLLSGANGQIILRMDDGQVLVISQGNARDIRFPDLPGGLITRPTLRWLVQSANSGSQQVELTYLTSGMTWSADYTLLLAMDNHSLDLNGWITLNNTSGASYHDAQVKLIAGDINRLPQPQSVLQGGEGQNMAAPAAPPVEQRNFSEYKLYQINRPVTVADNETKQVEFVTGSDVPASTFFVYDASYPFQGYYSPITDQTYGQTGITNVQNWLQFSTAEDGGVGAALPAGNVRVYQQDVDGAALLIGENSIDHTPKGENVQLFLGNAFDLVGSHTQTNFQLIGSNVLDETYEIHLRNHKEDQGVEIRVPEHLFRWSNWQITSSSQDYNKLDSSTIEFRAQVPANGETVITYTVRYSWP